jgi:signal transduction histidine kinase
MSEPARPGIRDLWLPATVALAGVLASFAFWGLLIGERRDHLRANTADVIAESREGVELELAEQVQVLRGLADRWARFGPRPEPAWAESASQRVSATHGMAALAWVQPDPARSRIATRAGAGPSDDGAADAAIALGRDGGASFGAEPRWVGPERLASGRVAYLIELPVGANAEDGVLVGVFEVEPLLDRVLRGTAPGFAIAVDWAGQRVFERGKPSADPWQTWWRAESDVALPLGGTWHLVYRPTAELAAARLTPLPHYLLAVGVLLSIAMALAAHQLRVISHQSRRLATANRALERRGDQLEEQVAPRTSELREVVAELEAFNHSVSHDLRSPLGAILNCVAILEEDHRDRPLGDDGLAWLDRIRHAATRASDLLEDLLQLSQAGRAALRVECVDMTDLARETFAQVRAAEGDFDVEFLLDPLPETQGDRTLLGDVFANLFGNALKYSRGREKRRIAVTGRMEEGENVYVVADNGCGFDMRFSEKLFGLFERLHHDEEVDGTGVGLAMVARIVGRHRGRVWAEGRPGEGATFFFSVPRPAP